MSTLSPGLSRCKGAVGALGSVDARAGGLGGGWGGAPADSGCSDRSATTSSGKAAGGGGGASRARAHLSALAVE